MDIYQHQSCSVKRFTTFFSSYKLKNKGNYSELQNYSNSGLSKRYATLFSCKAFVHIKILVKTTGSLHFHLIYFFQCFAAEFPDTIFVAVHPGWVQTDMGNSQAWHTSKLVFSMRMRRRDFVNSFLTVSVVEPEPDIFFSGAG